MALYFHLQNEKDGDLLLLEQEIDRYVDGVELLTAVHLSNEVERVLSRIPSGVNNVAKRELARALGEASVQPSMVKDTIIKQFVRPSTFYNKNKSWLHDPEYRVIMETVIKLYRKWDSGRAARELADKQQAWRETIHGKAEQMATAVDRFIKSALEIIDQPLYEQVVEADGETIKLIPGKWTQETANRRIEAAAKAIDTADKLARLALDMPDTPTEQHIITADVSDGADKVQEVRSAMMAKMNAMRAGMAQIPPLADAPDDEEE